MSAWSTPRLQRHAKRLQRSVRHLRLTGGAPNVAIPPQLQGDRLLRVARQPARRQLDRQAYRGLFQFDYRTWATVGGKGDPAAAPARRAVPPRRDALPPRRRRAVARLRPLTRSSRRRRARPRYARRVDVAALRSAFPVLEQRRVPERGHLRAAPRAPPSRRPRDAWQLARQRAAARAPTSSACSPHATACAAPTPALLGAEPDDVALTTSTSEGIGRVLAGLDLRPGDEVLTAPRRAPGPARRRSIAARDAARRRRSARRRSRELADAVGPATTARRLLARQLEHRRDRRPTRSRELDVPVLLDGAQGVGAVPVDVARARLRRSTPASGQKWLCGPIGTGMLWVAPRVARARSRPGALPT